MTVFILGSLVLVLLLLYAWRHARRRRRLMAEPFTDRLVGPAPIWLKISLGGVGLLLCGCLVKILSADVPRSEHKRKVEVAEIIEVQGTRGRSPSKKRLQEMITRLRTLHSPMRPVRPGDWLAHHREPGQTFEEYLRSRPTTPTKVRSTIYIQPVGTFPPKERSVLHLTADFLSRYFCLPVKITKNLPLSAIPKAARRTHPTWGDHQILTTYVLDHVLKPRLPPDAVCYLALTSSDLWPGRGWNFVFGQASLRERVGVWSMYRNGDPNQSQAGYRQFLLRTLKTATHETGHMLSMWHCTKHECNMCGSNSRAESDRRPLALCPECLAKVAWASRCDVVRRYRSLQTFCRRHGLSKEAARYGGLLGALLSQLPRHPPNRWASLAR